MSEIIKRDRLGNIVMKRGMGLENCVQVNGAKNDLKPLPTLSSEDG